MFIRCTEETYKVKVPAELQDKAGRQCVDGCTRLQSQILSCYDEANNSCKGMAECIKQSDLME